MRVGILHNCQHSGLANAIRFLHPEWQVISFELGTLRNPELQTNAASQLSGCDAVFSMPVVPGKWGPLGDWGPLTTDALKNSCRVHVLPAVTFAGFHPDTVYVNGPEGHFRAASGPYHSRIAIAAYLAGINSRDAELLFNTLIFDKLGYFESYNKSREFLISTFRQFEIEIDLYFDRWRKLGCFMHSINHPKISVLCDLAAAACSHLGTRDDPDDSRLLMVPDTLAVRPQMPMYPEIAREIGGGCKGNSLFRSGSDAAGNVFPVALGPYLRLCYDKYADAQRDALMKADGVANAMQMIQ